MIGSLRARLVALYRQRALTMFIMLAVASAACIVMLAARVIAFDSRAYLFMVWNLFLAWIPFIVSFFLYRLRPKGRLVLLAAGCAWLAFLPNAPYMVTDLIHLQTTRSAPIWYDSVMLATFAWTGLFLALVSLRMMQSLVRRRFGNPVSWAFALVIIGMSGFGVYLGRVQRWNSWDLVANPSRILGSIFNVATDPFGHPKAVVMTLLMATFLTIVYMMTSVMLPETAERGDQDI